MSRREEARGVIAYKFLARGAVGPFSGFAWPTPEAGAPGAWVEAPPADRIYACAPSDLPWWLGDELWVAELSGDARGAPYQVVASRGRLLARVEAWDEVALAFGADCAAALRARVEAALAEGVPAGTAALLRGYADDAEECARAGDAAAAAFVAARASVALAGDPDAFAAERRRQAAWLADRLGIAEAPRP